MPPTDPSVTATSGGGAPDQGALLALQRRALGVLAGLAPEAIELGQTFAAAGHELALVGGPVPDLPRTHFSVGSPTRLELVHLLRGGSTLLGRWRVA